MSEEPTLSDAERKEILESIPKASPSPSISSSDNGKAAGEPETFGSLLERTLAKRATVEETDTKADDELRKKIIESSRIDLIGKIFR